MATRDLAMTPDGDEIYFGVSVAGRSMIMVTRQVDGVWTEPVVAPFSDVHLDLEPCISPDGKRFYFLSTRPQEGQEARPGWVYQDIWVMDRGAGSWGEPYNLGPPVNSEAPEYYPSVTADGTLYFTREGEKRQSFIYRSRLVDGKHAEPEKLGPEVNSGASQFNAFVAPDESYIIVPVMGRDDSLGGVDYYVVFRDEQDNWSSLINMGEKINQPTGREWSAYVSRDGQYLFFMSSRVTPGAQGSWTGRPVSELLDLSRRPGYGSEDIYWVDARVIEKLRPE